MREGNTILYVGGFILPDGNAAAQRVISNAKLFLEVGFNVAFLNYSRSISAPRIVEYSGFECFEYPGSEIDIISSVDVGHIEEIVSKRKDINCIVAYNYPAFALFRLTKLCHSKGLVCISDVTEWYRARDAAFFKIPLKYIDTVLRMRYLLPRMDGLIVISDYLRRFYIGRTKMLLLPPLVDAKEEKWRTLGKRTGDGVTKFVYAGKPSRTKERLDLIVEAIASLPEESIVELDIIGITRSEFIKMYQCEPEGNRIVFHGRLSHKDTIEFVKQADYSLIIRDDNRVTRAGFPSKFVESIACGTPVVCNDNSDLKTWIQRYGCGFVVDAETLGQDFANIIASPRPNFSREIFDYHNFCSEAVGFFDSMFSDGGMR